ncbi:Uncharacterised protein [Mycobacterium tuberculosis]|uniref:Uncharacterized protein n=1 Tax=Mycobacterium tuberculosis TaxID=1773 RepID=A0A916PDG0_MYCTX|nr:Uncharacterised protein [Mycobacterium tuberculosis]
MLGFEQGMSLVDDAVHPVGDHRLKQRLLGREMPVYRACADSGAPSDLVNGHR